jgi:hypothetical protein
MLALARLFNCVCHQRNFGWWFCSIIKKDGCVARAKLSKSYFYGYTFKTQMNIVHNYVLTDLQSTTQGHHIRFYI